MSPTQASVQTSSPAQTFAGAWGHNPDMDLSLETVVSVALGLGLAAAAGFRVFVPLLVLNLASRFGYVPLAPGWEWVGGTPALLVFATATVCEVVGYYVPWVDHALDTVATPAAVVAGMLTSASVITDLPPLVKWTAVVVGGGGLAALVQGSTVALRAGSTAMSGGLANPLVATVETFGASLLAIVAVGLPLVALLFVAAVVLVIYKVGRWMLMRVSPRA